MHRVISQIGGGNQPVARKLFLECDVPLLHIARLHMSVPAAEAAAELREGVVSRELRRRGVWIGTVDRPSKGIEHARRIGNVYRKRPRIRGVLVPAQRNRVVENAEPGANGFLTITPRIVNKP